MEREYNLDFFQEWLDKYINFERAADARLFRLETTNRLAELFSHPELTYKTYHVTGSKGKGSVSRMLGCILSEMDKEKPVGVYASPHVYDFRERIGAAEGFLNDDVYNKTVEEFTKKVDELNNSSFCGSWFELNAAFSFLAYKNAGCRHAVFEVGMGGRLDATNIIKPEICCITRIELEHTKFLGDTLEKIASEKAGIIKENTPVVIAKQKTESVNEVFKKKAEEKHAPVYFVDDLAKIVSLEYNDQKLEIVIEGKVFARPLHLKLKMLSKVQALNAMQAAVAAKIAYSEITEEMIERGLNKASLPGRFEIRGNVVLDGAHTPESIKETLETFESLYSGEECNLLFGMVEGKDLKHIVPMFKNRFKKIFVTRPGDFKKSNMEMMRQAFLDAEVEAEFDEDFERQIKRALRESGKAPLLVTGSFYLLGLGDWT